jgi:hypothetical protein
MQRLEVPGDGPDQFSSTPPAPTPATTIAILTGASEWPMLGSLERSDSFLNSANSFEDYLTSNFKLPRRNLLPLFDSNDEVNNVLRRINDFIEERKKNAQIRDVLYYYVGHGDFLDGQGRQFYLPIRTTRSGFESTSGLMAEALAARLREQGRFLRQFIVLDCCFSAAAYSAFQSSPGGFVVRKLQEELPSRGVTMLCSSSCRDRSRILEGGKETMFTAAFVTALRAGQAGAGERLSFADIAHLTEQVIIRSWPEEAVRPELHSPRRPEGDIREVPFFPNPAHLGGRQPAQTSSSIRSDMVAPAAQDPWDFAARLQAALQRGLARNGNQQHARHFKIHVCPRHG